MVLQLLMWMLLLESYVYTCEELKWLLTKIMIIKNVFYWFLKKKKKKKGGGGRMPFIKVSWMWTKILTLNSNVLIWKISLQNG